MNRRVACRLAVVLAVLLAGACGEKQSAIRDGAAARRAALRESAPAEPAPPANAPVEVAAGGANPAAPADGIPATDGTGPPPATPAPADAAGGPPGAAPPGPPAAPLPAPARRSSGARGRSGPAYFSAEPQPFPQDSGAGPRSGPPSPGSPSPTRPAPAPAPAPPREVLPGPIDRTGVTDTTIRIGIHAPVTGAAPFPQKAFEQSYDLYWKYLAAKGGVWGRNVEVVFRDDQYNPTSAVEACRDMVEQQKVFAIIGFAGTDQINACARYAESAGVPYFSGGVNEDGLAGLNRYFAISQTYDQQS